MLRGLRWSVTLLVAVAVLVGIAERSHASSVYLQSVGASGQAANNASYHCSASSDGRYVAFASLATNLVAGHGNGHLQVYWHDRQTGETRILSTSGGVDGDQDSGTYFVAVSGEGHQVAYDSMAMNLLPGYGNGERQVYHHDTITGVTRLVSRSSNGVQGNNDSGYTGVSLSRDGRYVAFNSRATNLVSHLPNKMAQVYRHDVVTGITTLMSTDSNGVAGDNASFHCRISGDGLSVAFGSKATNLVPGYGHGQQVYVHQVQTGVTDILTVDSNGVEGNGVSGDAGISLSDDGRFITFPSKSTNLVPGYGGTLFPQVYLHDVQTRQTTIVSVSSNEVQGNHGSGSRSVAISPDGRYVAFDSWATNLVPGYYLGGRQVYVRDVVAGTTFIASTDAKGKQANGENGGNDVSMSSGRFVTFDSSATNLVSGVNGTFQVCQRDLDAGKEPLILDASANPIQAGDKLVAVTSLGIPGRVASLWWIGTNHVLHSPILIVAGSFSQGGTWKFEVGSFPDLGLSISELTLASFSTGPHDGTIQSQLLSLSTP